MSSFGEEVPSPVGGNIIHLEVTQAPLEQVLKIIEEQSNPRVYIHSALESDQLISANCTGMPLIVLKCTLGKDINLVYQYDPQEATHLPSHLTQISQIWILSNSKGVKLPEDSHENQLPLCNKEENTSKSSLTQLSSEGTLNLSLDEINHLADLTYSSDPSQRKSALARLALTDQASEPIREVMKTALQDSNPEVRAQAIFGLAKNRSPDLDSILSTALNDENMNVRLMAVSHTENTYLLQTALEDTSVAVQNFAKMKLEQISNNAYGK
ncbi:HEAT repeat domain-containing protein [Candidatus Nitrosacidococcus tergens]|uniref:PBS lyase HEAT domain protein repeat-containing protein n=1 Tax=Candidatus Nitrosacidococcus tergens TaxID=553981 RepID=A0A7G1Q8B4_9GAMM|nr:HEAT repeat domain-containing protein [Candidatus Nitrosacidococcus tergens]CAB1275098.1 conserved protein of unknown function [Candidatus Nitrosacidococcus tergens]